MVPNLCSTPCITSYHAHALEWREGLSQQTVTCRGVFRGGRTGYAPDVMHWVTPAVIDGYSSRIRHVTVLHKHVYASTATAKIIKENKWYGDNVGTGKRGSNNIYHNDLFGTFLANNSYTCQIVLYTHFIPRTSGLHYRMSSMIRPLLSLWQQRSSIFILWNSAFTFTSWLIILGRINFETSCCSTDSEITACCLPSVSSTL